MNTIQRLNRLVFPALLAVLSIYLVGCQRSTPVKVAPGPETSSSSSATDAVETKRIAGKQTAIQAKDELAQRLTARLVEAMSSSGPAAAIQVCSQEASKIASEVGEELGVKIGRTSFKLRNPGNQPPAWAQDFVDQKVDTPQFQQLDNGSTAALLPIKLQPQCLACHGDATAMPDAIREALAARYPEDQATGFAEGDLRGWFWIEVPSEK